MPVWQAVQGGSTESWLATAAAGEPSWQVAQAESGVVDDPRWW